MARRLANLVLLACLVAAGAWLLSQFNTFGNGLTAATGRILTADDWVMAAAGTDVTVFACMCADVPSQGIAIAVMMVLMAGVPLAFAAWWTTRRHLALAPDRLYVAFGVQCMNWTLSSVILLVMLLGVLRGEPASLHWSQAVVLANLAFGVPALWRWHDMLVAGTGRRPALLALR
jgi:hypothetical protein